MKHDDQSQLSPEELYEMDTWEPWRETLGRWAAVTVGPILFLAGVVLVTFSLIEGEIPRRAGTALVICFIGGPGMFFGALRSFKKRRLAREEALEALKKAQAGR